MGGPERQRSHRPACRRCHTRKVRCDATSERPCSGCRSSGTECIAHQKRRRNRGPPKPDILPLLLPTPLTGSSPSEQLLPDEAIHVSYQEQTLSPGSVTTSLIVADDQSEVGRAAAALSSLQDATPGNADTADVKRHLVEMLSQDDIDDRIMQKGVRIVYVGQEYSNINYLIRHRARNEAVHHFPANQISRQFISHELDRIPKEAFTLPSASVVDELLENYFRYVNPGFPIVDEEVFMSQYRGRDPLNPPSLLVLQAVLMVGAHVSRQRPDRDELKASFFRRAKMLFDARFEWNRDVVVQAALLLTWHSEGVEDIGANSYFWVGVAARTAMGLGMHRDTGPSTLIGSDKRLWRRLWWILVQFDVTVSLSYGRPQAVNLDDCDVPPLRPSDFDVPRESAEVEFVIHQTSLCSIISGVIRERFGLKVPASRKREALIASDRMLAEWMDNLPRKLKGLPGDSSRTPWANMLHVNYNNFLILLHRPPPRPATLATVVKQDDMEICSTAASTMVGLLETIWCRNELRYLNVFAVDALFTALIQLSAEIRVSNPILSANAMRKFDSALDILRSLAEYWLNAEIILRLFEDSSERMRQELGIGKSAPKNSKDDGLAAQNPDAAMDIQADAHETWQSFLPTNEAIGQIGMLSEHVDWTNMYWENSGFPSLSPYGDLGLYPPT